MAESKRNNDNFEKIKVFSSEDEKLKLLGELLTNKSSRDIIKLLMNEEHYTNEIANKLDLRPNLVIHHLKKLEELGLLEITNKRIVKKGIDHKYYKMIPGLFIVPNQDKNQIRENGFLKKLFRDGISLTLVAFAGVITWLGTTINSNKILVDRGSSDTEVNMLTENLKKVIDLLDFYSDSIIITSAVVGSSLLLMWVSKKRKEIRGLSH